MFSLRSFSIALLAVSIILIGLFVGSFFFFDQASRVALTYDVRFNDALIGTVRIDRFKTEDKIIYKQSTDLPCVSGFIALRAKSAYSPRYELMNYTEEDVLSDNITLIRALEVKDGRAAFLSRAQSSIVWVDDLPLQKETFVLREDSPFTLMPIIENYDFRKGRSQGFHVLVFPAKNLPPMKNYVTLTSIRDEYLKVDGRRIKTEVLVMKMRYSPQGMVWVAKADRRLIAIDLPAKKLRIVRRFKQKTIAPHGSARAPEYAREKEVVFRSGSVQLAGVLATPQDTKPSPAVLLIPGTGPYGRNYNGLYSSLADGLASHGIASLRFDPRGIGKSGGDASWPLSRDTTADIRAALAFLSGSPEIDPARIAVIAHDDGALAAAAAAADTDIVRAVILLAPSIRRITDFDAKSDALAETAKKSGWDEEYRRVVSQAAIQTRQAAEGAQFGWTYLLGKRCSFEEMRTFLDTDPIRIMQSIAVPVFIIQGTADQEPVGETAAAVDRALASAGNAASSLVYCEGIGHSFGDAVIDETGSARLVIAPCALDKIRTWINMRLPEKQALPKKEEPTS